MDTALLVPHKMSPCSGKYGNCLDVMLTPVCNGSCFFCIEKYGYHPIGTIPPSDLARMINCHPAETVLLLGGEPLLYNGLNELLAQISSEKKVVLTTNGSLLTGNYVQNHPHLRRLSAINLSIHHHDKYENQRITGVELAGDLDWALKYLGVPARWNCNLLKWGVDCFDEAAAVISKARKSGVFSSVRFAEVIDCEPLYVGAEQVFGNKGKDLPEDAWEGGCESEDTLLGMPVTIRRVCKFLRNKETLGCGNTPCSPKGPTKCGPSPCKPKNTVVSCHESGPGCHGRSSVLYYNGEFSQGWKKNVKLRDYSGS